VSEPEQKRKIIGRLFVDVFKAEAEKLKAANAGSKGATFLAQGTIYPDVIESGGAKSKKAVIKSHHNVGGLPEQLGLKLLEPLRDLFKDEVRELGVALGLPAAWSTATPSRPRPGRAHSGRSEEGICRPAAPRRCHLHRRAEQLDRRKDRQELVRPDQPGLHRLPARQERGRDGRRPHLRLRVALRAVVTSDFMTADWAELPYGLLKKVSGRIINEVRGINRVTYDVSTKPPATIEWE
jgi:GMP synthase (glutamine-hydrolysing)